MRNSRKSSFLAILLAVIMSFSACGKEEEDVSARDIAESTNMETILEEGMVITIEPGIYLPNFGGVRIEDDVLVTKNGHEILTKLEKELKVVGK